MSTPAEHVREHLAASRAAGLSFPAAWEAALASVPPSQYEREGREWEVVLAATRSAWRRAYEGRPSARAERTAAALAGMASGAYEVARFWR